MAHRQGRPNLTVAAAVTAMVIATGAAFPGGNPEGDAARRMGVMAPSAAQTPEGRDAMHAASKRVWARLADCESGDAAVPGSARWNAATGNGYFGGLQFSRSSWAEVGGVGDPHRADRDQQIEMARRLHRRYGFSAWPACARRLGLPMTRHSAG